MESMSKGKTVQMLRMIPEFLRNLCVEYISFSLAIALSSSKENSARTLPLLEPPRAKVPKLEDYSIWPRCRAFGKPPWARRTKQTKPLPSTYSSHSQGKARPKRMGDPTVGKRWVILEDWRCVFRVFPLIWGIKSNIQLSRFILDVTVRP